MSQIKLLTRIQYNKICKYWKVIDNISCKLSGFDYLQYCSSHYRQEQELSTYIENLKGKITYYEQEYEKYINSIGFVLNDRTYDEELFQLLNNGIVLDEEKYR